MNDITNTVTMNLEDFLEMRDNEENFFTLLDAILDNTRLGYSDSYLVYSDDAINAALRFIAPERYKQRINKLKFDKAHEKED